MDNASQPVSAGSLKRALSNKRFFRDAPEAFYQSAYRGSLDVQVLNPKPLLAEGESSPYAWFLIEGSVDLEQRGGERRTLHARDADAEYPLGSLQPNRYTLIPELRARLIRMERSLLKRLERPTSKARFQTSTQGGGSWQSHPFAVEISRLIDDDALEIPTLPSISARIGEAMQDPEFSLSDLAKLISADPTLAGQLIKIANSVMFKRYEACSTLDQAIVRLGVDQSRTLVLSLSTRSIFQARRSWVRAPLKQVWRHAVNIAAYCAVLARVLPGFESARGLLLGLLHELGAVPILERAERFGDLEQKPGILEETLLNLAPRLTSRIMSQWGLDGFVEPVLQQTNWSFESDPETAYADVLIVAHLHEAIANRETEALPRLDQIPAFGKLSDKGLSASTGVTVLNEAREEITELRTLLG